MADRQQSNRSKGKFPGDQDKPENGNAKEAA
jgi:hypothetical protein